MTTYLLNLDIGYSKQYYIPITIVEISGHWLENYVVKIELNSSNFDGWYYLVRGANICFLDMQGNPLYYWIEKLDLVEQRILIWVKIPSIPPKGAISIYMYLSKNISCTKYNDPDKVFLFFENFYSNPNHNGKWEIYRHMYDLSSEAVWDPDTHRFYLTKAVEDRGVAVFFKNITTPAQGFRVIFWAGSRKGAEEGGDGIAFTFFKDLQPYRRYGNVATGGTLGLSGYNYAERRIAPSQGYAVELDNHDNSKMFYDPSSNHIAIIYMNSNDKVPWHHLVYYNTNATEDGETHKYEVLFYDREITVYLDGKEIIKYTFGSLNTTYTGIGFTSATGSQANDHWLEKYVILTPYIKPEPLVVLGTYNELLNRINKLEKDINEIMENITVLNNSLNRAIRLQAKMNDTIRDLYEKQQKHETTLNDLYTEINELNERISNLELMFMSIIVGILVILVLTIILLVKITRIKRT